jgi:hypothetical protein
MRSGAEAGCNTEFRSVNSETDTGACLARYKRRRSQLEAASGELTGSARVLRAGPIFLAPRTITRHGPFDTLSKIAAGRSAAHAHRRRLNSPVSQLARVAPEISRNAPNCFFSSPVTTFRLFTALAPSARYPKQHSGVDAVRIINFVAVCFENRLPFIGSAVCFLGHATKGVSSFHFVCIYDVWS